MLRKGEQFGARFLRRGPFRLLKYLLGLCAIKGRAFRPDRLCLRQLKPPAATLATRKALNRFLKSGQIDRVEPKRHKQASNFTRAESCASRPALRRRAGPARLKP